MAKHGNPGNFTNKPEEWAFHFVFLCCALVSNILAKDKVRKIGARPQDGDSKMDEINLRPNNMY